MRAARRQLLRIADELEAIAFRLRGVQESLPEPVAESVRLMDVERMDAAAELRTVVACVLTDWMGPAIRDLRDVVKGTGGTVEP